MKCVTPNDLRDVVNALLVQAKGGDVAATNELLQRLLGPPVELDLIERLDALERRLADVNEDDQWSALIASASRAHKVCGVK